MRYSSLIFWILVHVLAIAGIFTVTWSSLSFSFILFSIIYFMIGMFGFNIGWHRYFSHNSFKTSPLMEKILFLMGNSVMIGSFAEFLNDHFNHHTYLGSKKDPQHHHNGIFYAHIGWAFYPAEIDHPKVLKNKLAMHAHKYASFYTLTTGLVIPLIVGSYLQDFWSALTITLGLRVTLQYAALCFLGSICHKKEGSKEISINSLFVSMLSLGEGFQKNHHEDCRDYRHGYKWYDFDPSKWIIWTMSKLNLVWDLRTRKVHREIKNS